jgi:hypothetical protein
LHSGLEYERSTAEEQHKRFEKSRKKGNAARKEMKREEKKRKENNERMKSQGRQTGGTSDTGERNETWQIEKSTLIPDSIEERRGEGDQE